jgi:glyoxylase-like metal-dependent hydrolase (beta-lactamase superfamily II)
MTVSDHISVQEYAGGIHVIDAGFHREHMAACYLMEADSEVAFIEVGTNSSTARLMKTLNKRGWKPQDVRYVIVTHVHLDHAGGSGSLMQLLPNATFLVHPYGARHMIDPSKLEAGSRAIYGDQVSLGNRQLRFMDTPGHARHHFCVHDSLTNGWFTGDTFGLSYREFDTQNGAFLVPTTTPIQFDPVPLKESVRKLVEIEPDYMYLTHYGRVDDVQRLSKKMIEGVDKLVEIAERYKDDDLRTQKIETAMSDWFMDGLSKHGVSLSQERCLELFHSDVKLNTAGLEIWLDRRDRSGA